jgi:hypothetical protein
VLWWIALGVVVLALVVFVGVLASFTGRVGEFRRIAAGLRRRVERIQQVQAAAWKLQERAGTLQQSLESINDRVAVLQARRGGRHPLVDRLDGPAGVDLPTEFDVPPGRDSRSGSRTAG